MGARSSSNGWLFLLAAAVLVGYWALRPAATRVESGPPRESPAEFGTGGTIPEDVLRVPEQLAEFGGMGGHAGDGYWYMPYAIVNEAQGIAMVEALRVEILKGNGFPAELHVAEGQGAAGTDRLYPIQDGVTRRFMGSIDDTAGREVSESMIPLIISQPEPGHASADVLYMDGHLASVPVGRFPLSPGFIDALSALDTPEHQEKNRAR